MNPGVVEHVLSVSVVMPAYRAALTLERAVRSVAAQTRPPAELIIVDDASDDATPRFVEELQDEPWPFALRSLTLKENLGPGEARNAGWKIATGDWVAFLDADDEWLPRKLERQGAWMCRHPEYTWSAHRCVWPGSDAARDLHRHSEIDRFRLLWRNPVATPTVLMRRDVAPRFRPGWRHCEDLMLWQDVLSAGGRGALLHEPLARLGRRPTTLGGLTGDLPAMHAGEMRAVAHLRRERRMGALTALVWRTVLRVKYRRRQWIRQ